MPKDSRRSRPGSIPPGPTPDAVADPDRIDLHAPAEIVWIVRTLERAGYSAWAVGGAIRDALAGQHPEDWDVATAARPDQVRTLFRRTVPIGIEHGTVGVIGRSGRMIEVTTFRQDVESFGRRSRVVFSSSLDEDLDRRDFTINAIAWHPLTGELRDPHEGRKDLLLGRLRAVGDPELRFAEDRLRVLRALRFAGRFRMKIESATDRAIRNSAGALHHLSAERIREELWKILTSQRTPSTSLRLYAESGVLGALYPELEALRSLPGAEPDTSLWEDTLRAVDTIPPTRPGLRIAALLHALGEGADLPDPASRAAHGAAIARAMLTRLKSSNALLDRVVHLIAMQAPVPSPESSDADLRRWVRKIGRDYLPDMLRLLTALCRAGAATMPEGASLRELWRGCRGVLRSGVPLTLSELAIGGSELRALGIPPGPRFGEILRELLERVTEEPALNRPERLLELVRSSPGGPGEVT